MSATKKSISLPVEMWDKAAMRARSLGYSKMSQYLQYLVRQDLLTQGDHVRVAETSPPYRVTPSASKAGSRRKVVDILKDRRAKKKAAASGAATAPEEPAK